MDFKKPDELIEYSEKCRRFRCMIETKKPQSLLLHPGSATWKLYGVKQLTLCICKIGTIIITTLAGLLRGFN